MYGGVLGLIQAGYTNIDNCYNEGDISAEADAKLGGILGIIEINEHIKITNCSTISNAIGDNKGTSSDQIITNVKDNQTNLPSIISIVNTDNEGVFVEDTNNINDGYPILKWQLQVKNKNI